VVLLRDRGRRVTKAQIDAAPALVGLLVIGPEPPGTSQGGARGRAELHRPGAGELGSVHKPLFNPVVERMDARGIVLSGYEIDTVDGVPVQYVQAWLVKLLAGTNR
jgi:hypothetical protein